MRGRLYRYRYLLLGMSVLVMFGLIASAAALDGIEPARATWHRAAAAVPPAEVVAVQLADLGTGAVPALTPISPHAPSAEQPS